jgi:hypothetical protein
VTSGYSGEEIAAAPRYITSARTAQQTPLQKAISVIASRYCRTDRIKTLLPWYSIVACYESVEAII